MNHPNRANVSKADIQAQIAKFRDVRDPTTIFLFGFRSAFGGGKSTGFGLIYDNIDEAQKFEPAHRLVRAGLKEKKAGSKKERAERKQREKKTRGTGRRVALHKAKKAS